jgi:hypothetical protein
MAVRLGLLTAGFVDYRRVAPSSVNLDMVVPSPEAKQVLASGCLAQCLARCLGGKWQRAISELR